MNASSRLKRKPDEPVPVPAMERLAAARMRKAYLEKVIEAVSAARREALLVDDDECAAEADRQLLELHLAMRRVVDKIGLLIPAVEAECQHADWPDKVPAARALLERLEQRQRALNNRPRLDRSASNQDDLDVLVCRVPALRLHLKLLERMAS